MLSEERWGAAPGREQQKGKRTGAWHGRKNMLKFNSPCVYYGVAKIGDERPWVYSKVTKVKGIWKNGAQRVG